jgi:sec-independent protein translocase protein TatC
MAQGVMGSDDEARMTVIEHLTELRRVLIISLSAWGACTVLAGVFNGFLIGVLTAPLKATLAKGNHLVDKPIYTSPTEGVTIPLKVAMIGGLILSLPIVLWQIWSFISPGLRPVERKFAGPFIASALLLFATGASFAYFLMPIFLNILQAILSGNATYFPDLNEYLSFFTLLILVFGATFELPIVVIMLGLLGIVSSRTLRSKRKVIWVVIIIAANVVTPGADPFTPMFLAVPLVGLFELSILILAKPLKR